MSHLLRGAIARDLNNLQPPSILTYVSTPAPGLRLQVVDLTRNGASRDEVHELIRLNIFSPETEGKMKKIKKKCYKHWTRSIVVIIVCASCLNHHFLSTLIAGQPDEGGKDKEAGIAQADADVSEPKRKLQETRRQLKELRESYSDLYLKHQAKLEELAQLRMQAANLLGAGARGEESAERRQAEVLTELLEMHRQHSQLYRQVEEFGDYLQTVLAIIEPSQALRREIERHYVNLQSSVTRVENLPSIVAWRGGAAIEGRSEARVIRVEEELQIVVLDTGAADRVRPGSVWRIDLGDDAQAPVKVRVMETRSDISAAIPVEGDLSLIAAGMTAERINPE